MAGIPYKDVVDVLLDRFPEFTATPEFEHFDLDLPYSVWGGFARFATTYLSRTPADRLDEDPFVARIFDLANDLMDSDDSDTQNIVIVELFENLAVYRKPLEVARRKLKKEHLTWLEKQTTWLRASDLHYEGELIAPQGLDALSETLSGCSWQIKVARDKPSAAPYIASYHKLIDLTMDPGKGPTYAFFGDISGTAETNGKVACRLLDDLSQCLIKGDVAHRIDLYRTNLADELLESFRHNWPSGDPNHC